MKPMVRNSRSRVTGLLVIAAFATGTVIVACDRDPATIPSAVAGGYRASVVDRSSPALMRVFSAVHPEAEKAAPTGALLVSAEFTAHTGPPRDRNCGYSVVVTAPPMWQVIGMVGRSYVMGVGPQIDQLLRRNSQVPQHFDDAGIRVADATVFGIRASEDRPPLIALWDVPPGSSAESVRVGVAASCDGQLTGFDWLRREGDFLE